MSRCIVGFNEGPSEPENPLRRARVAAAISQRQAAEHIGVTPHLLNDTEHGRAALGFERIEKLHAFYDAANASKTQAGIVVCQSCGKITGKLPNCVHCGKMMK